MEDKTIMLTVRIPKSRLDELDATAQELGTTRSELIRARLAYRLADLDMKIKELDYDC